MAKKPPTSIPNCRSQLFTAFVWCLRHTGYFPFLKHKDEYMCTQPFLISVTFWELLVSVSGCRTVVWLCCVFLKGSDTCWFFLSFSVYLPVRRISFAFLAFYLSPLLFYELTVMYKSQCREHLWERTVEKKKGGGETCASKTWRLLKDALASFLVLVKMLFPSIFCSLLSGGAVSVLWASDLHPLIHELLLPKSSLSFWEISPHLLFLQFFFHPLTPPPAFTFLFLSHMLSLS